MKKIKLNYSIAIGSKSMSFAEIEKIVSEFETEKIKQLENANCQERFEIVTNVEMPLESITLR